MAKNAKKTDKKISKSIYIVLGVFALLLIVIAIFIGTNNKKSHLEQKSNNTENTKEVNKKDNDKVECIYYSEDGKRITGRVEEDGSFTQFVECENSNEMPNSTISDNNSNAQPKNDNKPSNEEVNINNNNNNNINNGSNTNKTQKDNNAYSNRSIDNKDEYSCPSGYKLEGDKCYETINPTITYKCARGTVAGDSCIINTSVPANATYQCATGTLSGDTCYISRRVSSYNPADYEGMRETNKISIYNNFQNNCANSKGQYEHENGITYCVVTTTTPANASYDCNGKEGTLAGSTCVSAKVEKAFAEYSCPDGYNLILPNCSKKIDATKK